MESETDCLESVISIRRPDLVAMITQSTAEVCQMMLDLNVAAEEAYTDQTAPSPCDGITSFIGLAGKWAGTGGISCTAKSACKMSSRLLMGEFSSVDDEVLDAIAEITNMIIGNVKTRLEEALGPMGLSVPTVIYGRNFMRRTTGNEWIVVPFRWEGDRFEVQICLAPVRDPNGVRLAQMVPVPSAAA